MERQTMSTLNTTPDNERFWNKLALKNVTVGKITIIKTPDGWSLPGGRIVHDKRLAINVARILQREFGVFYKHDINPLKAGEIFKVK